MSQWLITQGNNQFSVNGLADLEAMARKGDLKSGDMIQPPGASDWMYAAEVPQLAAIFGEGGADDDLDMPKKGNLGMILGAGLAGVVLLFGGAAAYFAQNLPQGNEVLIGEGGLSYSQMLVTDQGQSLLAEADERSRATTSLKKDEVLDLLSKRGDYYRARTRGGAEGWIKESAVIPMYQLGGEDVRAEYDPLYNPDRYVEVANASWQQLPPEKPRRGASEDEGMITAFNFNLWNSSKYTMTDIVLQATLKDAKGAEIDTIEFSIEGEIPGERGTMVGTLKPPEDEEDGESRLLTAYSFGVMSKDDPELMLRYVDGVEVQLEAQDFTNAAIDIVELRAVPDDKAKGDVSR